ncbi:hypothetical protein SAMN02745130_01907 [Thiothrix eikelboomii]|uniref:Uncharacterized protein n=2 Tax=Thiothrix eikelboomii TaxID=92487 RepID=A0A1T4WNE1_9GAMM|nr:hypothetical protein SAMN02745130_01907 [Thiothrix eikelboomii]
MLPALGQGSSTPQEKRLRSLFRELAAQDQASLLKFAEFLASSATVVVQTPETCPEPVLLARPTTESVVKAIKRLKASYPMLSADKLLSPTSDLMAAHLIKGRPANEIIDELEQVFVEHYQQFKASWGQPL